MDSFEELMLLLYRVATVAHGNSTDDDDGDDDMLLGSVFYEGRFVVLPIWRRVIVLREFIVASREISLYCFIDAVIIIAGCCCCCCSVELVVLLTAVACVVDDYLDRRRDPVFSRIEGYKLLFIMLGELFRVE